MDLQLKGRRVLVTGSSSGIGEGIARMLVAQGAAVAVHGRDRNRAAQLAAAIGAGGIALGALSPDAAAAVVAPPFQKRPFFLAHRPAAIMPRSAPAHPARAGC